MNYFYSKSANNILKWLLINGSFALNSDLHRFTARVTTLTSINLRLLDLEHHSRTYVSIELIYLSNLRIVQII